MRRARFSFFSITTVFSMPRARRATAVMTPIGPAPITAHASAGVTAPMSSPCSATASGSTRAPCSSSISSGSRQSISASTQTASAYAPGCIPSPMPVFMATSRSWRSIGLKGKTHTCAPSQPESTPSPTASTTPANS